MTVPVQTPYNAYNSNGATTQFRYEFLILAAADLSVTLNGAAVPASAYTLTAIGQSNGGNVTFKTAPAAGVLIIQRAVVPERLTDYQDNGPLLAENVNRDFDRVVMMIQDKQAESDVSLKHPLGQNGTTVPYTFDAKKGRVTNLADPVNPTDAVHKGYVDKQFTDVGKVIIQQAEAARDAAVTARDQAVAASTAAGNSQTASKASETAAAASAKAAKDSETVAGQSRTAAAQSQSAAAQSQSQASASAQGAAAAAQGATDQATLASASATTAGQKATAAAQSASQAAQAASSAAGAMTAAQAAQTAAEKARDEAVAASPVGYLKVASNLNDVANKTTSLQNLQDGKPLGLVADPVNAYDATTKRWVENLVGAGTTGPTMNGVMNFGVGQPTHWTSRAFIPSFALPMDGQIVNRADWPELWAHAQQHGAISDSVWIADKTQRGKYSMGNGSTTFRLPDFNGTQTNGVGGFTGADSIRALFVRGDGGSQGAIGTVAPSGAPNITGSPGGTLLTYTATTGDDIGTGAFKKSDLANLTGSGSAGATGTTRPNYITMDFDASQSSSVYGGTTTEIRPNNVMGVWIVRASGGFVAANTQWDVINGDATAPANGTYVLGGRVRSVYNIGGAAEIVGGMRVGKSIGQTGKGDLTFFLSEKSGATTIDTLYGLGGPTGAILTDAKTGLGAKGGAQAPNDADAIAENGIFAGPGDPGVNWGNKYSALLNLSRYASGSSRAQLQIDPGGTLSVRGGNATKWFAWLTMQAQGTSGREFKRDITPADSAEALARINSLDLVNFIYKDDEQERVRFGVIAEDAEKIAPQYIKHREETVTVDGEVVTRDHPRVDTTPMVMDLLGAVQELQKQIDAMRA